MFVYPGFVPSSCPLRPSTALKPHINSPWPLFTTVQLIEESCCLLWSKVIALLWEKVTPNRLHLSTQSQIVSLTPKAREKKNKKTLISCDTNEKFNWSAAKIHTSRAHERKLKFRFKNQTPKRHSNPEGELHKLRNLIHLLQIHQLEYMLLNVFHNRTHLSLFFINKQQWK